MREPPANAHDSKKDKSNALPVAASFLSSVWNWNIVCVRGWTYRICRWKFKLVGRTHVFAARWKWRGVWNRGQNICFRKMKNDMNSNRVENPPTSEKPGNGKKFLFFFLLNQFLSKLNHPAPQHTWISGHFSKCHLSFCTHASFALYTANRDYPVHTEHRKQ